MISWNREGLVSFLRVGIFGVQIGPAVGGLDQQTTAKEANSDGDCSQCGEVLPTHIPTCPKAPRDEHT